jgi:hypothetical protein
MYCDGRGYTPTTRALNYFLKAGFLQFKIKKAWKYNVGGGGFPSPLYQFDDHYTRQTTALHNKTHRHTWSDAFNYLGHGCPTRGLPGCTVRPATTFVHHVYSIEITQLLTQLGILFTPIFPSAARNQPTVTVVAPCHKRLENPDLGENTSSHEPGTCALRNLQSRASLAQRNSTGTPPASSETVTKPVNRKVTDFSYVTQYFGKSAGTVPCHCSWYL